MASDPRAKLLRLLDARQELSEKMAAIDAEMRALVTGDEGIGDKLKRLNKFYSDAWSGRYGTPYVFNYAADSAQWKRLLKSMSVDELEARVWSFLLSEDKFYMQTRHAFGVFVKSINSLAGLPARGATAVVGCGHEPTCVDGAACTARKYAELAQ
ncbi:hypothetical protein UFOVP1601_19 [uncultured Caudovirales phage]|uniref:Uncharacterized protein n=1 Tax=uncultured Caudovirales phage TaxID=2100421 RepID=A0A6J5ST63_9CAUD|nr:hypothetical protein UFOVP1154_29 [uncultured Caudovirales phage]CAB4199830.1 hypothetical protein UFOVP1341_8 [uncultured Caudovirales phage]CAB4218450.1 hypothetical protein UFOVP1601_19 [uncultured Caudovirales phage]